MLVVFGVAGRFLTPLVPETPQNSLAGESASFLSQASTQEISWHPYDSTVLERARTEDRPILLVVGAPWSAYGRGIDKDTFSDGNVQEMLSRNFVCIRVDLVESPEFRSAFLPLSRVTT